MAIFYTEGVKYIKIARYDAYGNDNYQSLRQLDSVRIKTNDRGVINYPVLNITEYPSSSLNSPYFLYEIATTNITSSTNNQILNYRVSASSDGPIPDSFGILLPATEIGTKVTNYTENIDNLGYFDPTNGNYILGGTPNIPLIFTASCTFNYSGAPSENGTVYFNFIQGNSYLGRIKITSGSGLSGALIMSGSFTPIENQIYSLYVGTSGDNMDFTNIDFKITQSQSPVAGIGAQTILEPYITTPFVNSDYDILMNNAIANRPNSFYMDVDFADSQVLPINQQAILSSSATPAVIQDSNYSSAGWVNSRYIGKELTSQKLNVWTEGDISGDEKLPNVSNPKTYFVQFNWLAGTSPEWGDTNDGKTNVSIKYIIDENGNEVAPINDEGGINLGNIQQTFKENKATVVLSNPDAFGVNLNSLNTTVPVFKAGQKIKPVIYTQTASYDNNGNVIGYGYTGSITFIQGDVPNNLTGVSVNDYRLTTFANDGLNIINTSILQQDGTSTGVIKWNPPIQLGLSASFATSSAGVNPSTGSIYNPTGSLGELSGSGYILYLKAFIDINSNIRKEGANKQDRGFEVGYKIQKSTNGGTNWTSLSSYNFWVPANANYYESNTLLALDRVATTSSLYRVIWETGWNVNFPYEGNVDILPTSYFQVTQYPSPSTGNVTQFWSTGSGVGNILYAKTGSGANTIGLNDVYGQKQQNINQSGFDPITFDFEPQVYDEIRFGGTETQTYIITQVSQSLFNGYNALTLILDRNITNNTNTDYFLLRRYVDDPSNIILDISKPAGSTSDGLITPEFLGEKAKETKEKIMSLLRANQQT